MSNFEAFALVVAIWLLTGRGINLCFVIIIYYALYLAYPIVEQGAIVQTFFGEAVIVHASQLSFDTIALVLTFAISSIYHNSIKIYLCYGAIIATSAILNALMLFGIAYGIEELFYQAHAFRQNIAVPLDLLFAALGSSKGGQFTDYFGRGLLSTGRSVYNRFNRFSNYFKGA